MIFLIEWDPRYPYTLLNLSDRHIKSELIEYNGPSTIYNFNFFKFFLLMLFLVMLDDTRTRTMRGRHAIFRHYILIFLSIGNPDKTRHKRCTKTWFFPPSNSYFGDSCHVAKNEMSNFLCLSKIHTNILNKNVNPLAKCLALLILA